MITKSAGVAWIKVIWKKKLNIKLISLDVINMTTTGIIGPSMISIVEVCSNVIHIRVIKKVDKFIFVRRTICKVLCIKIT